MRFLLDTHAYLWWALDDPRLSLDALEIIEDSSREVILSAASVWEIAIKHTLGKLSLRASLERVVLEEPARNGFETLAMSPEHACRAGTLPLLHRDPFDRMLVAQAQLEEVVVTAQRRETSLQDTPLSIQAFTGEELEIGGIDNGRDLGIMVPNVVLNPGIAGATADFYVPPADVWVPPADYEMEVDDRGRVDAEAGGVFVFTAPGRALFGDAPGRYVLYVALDTDPKSLTGKAPRTLESNASRWHRIEVDYRTKEN